MPSPTRFQVRYMREAVMQAASMATSFTAQRRKLAETGDTPGNTTETSQMVIGSSARMSMVRPKRGHILRKSFLTTSQNRFQSKVLFIRQKVH